MLKIEKVSDEIKSYFGIIFYIFTVIEVFCSITANTISIPPDTYSNCHSDIVSVCLDDPNNNNSHFPLSSSVPTWQVLFFNKKRMSF